MTPEGFVNSVLLKTRQCWNIRDEDLICVGKIPGGEDITTLSVFFAESWTEESGVGCSLKNCIESRDE